ncbi:coil containing protein [Vibrio phage 1.257.O._10N.286.46.A4]|nr:coil containing protein [Vibrio phage 1.257.O._10N.286.46.A4]
MAGGFQNTRKAGDFPSAGRAASQGGAGTGEVDTVNGVSPDAAGNVQLTASDVGAHSRGDADNRFETKRATGTIGAADDPEKKPEGDYYVTESFIGAPTVASGNYVGPMRINLDFDGSDNGGLIEYITDAAVFYKPKFAGGWASDWIEAPKAQAAMARTLSTLGAEETALEKKVADLEKEVAALGGGGSAPTPTFDPSMFQSAVDHGYAADDQGAKSSKTTDGWWIFKDLSSVSGRPTGSIGDLVVFKNTIDTANAAFKHAFVMAIGQDQDLEDAIWFMYRDGTAWSSWFRETGNDKKQIDSIVKDVGSLKQGNAVAVSRLDAVQTAIGKIYAPSKIAFNDAVTGLINAALANYTPSKPSHGGDKPSLVFPRFYAQFSLGVPVNFTGAVTSTNAEATLMRIPVTRSRIFISVENENDEASKVKGFKFNNKQEMSLNHRDIVIDGKKYRAFYTSGAFTDKSVEIKVDFGQGI